MATESDQKVREAIKALAVCTDERYLDEFGKRILGNPRVFAETMKLVAQHEVRLARVEQATGDLAKAVELATKAVGTILGGGVG